MVNMKLFLVVGLVLLLGISLVYAQDHNFAEAEQLIDSGVGCNQLTDEQFELIGEYYMERMHPGEAHELMDEMMGGEGSANLRLVHINMGKRFYCKEYVGGMMGMMPAAGMMGGSVGNLGYGFGWNFFGFFYIILIIVLIAFIYFLTVKHRKGH